MAKKILLSICMFVLSFSALAQSGYTISTSVVDPAGEPVIGATVVEVENPAIGAYTDVMGQFTLKAGSPESTILISYAGFKPLQLKAGSELFKAPIVLQEDVTAIDAVTVVGYGTLRKNDMTGSVDVVSADLGDRGMVNSASEMIMGKVAGLQVTQGSGKPGAGSTIRIRGGASLSASNNPLVVIDGVPVANNAGAGMTNPLGAINPNDIASFTVLKDASAAAIYGSRGANGVIIITTKKGTAGKFNLSYNSDYSVGVNSRTVETLGADAFRTLVNDNFSDNANAMTYLGQFPDVSTNWQDHIYQTTFGTNQYVSGSGRVEGEEVQMGYRASLGYTHQDGTLKGSVYDRYTLDLGLSPAFFDNHLTVNLNFKGTLSDQDNVNEGAVGGAAFMDPTKPIYDDYAFNGENRFNGYFAYVDEVTGIPSSQLPSNPISLLTEEYNRDKSQRIITNMQIDYKMHFLPDLHANLNIGYDGSWGNNKKGSLRNSEQAWRDNDFRGVGRYDEWNGTRENSLLDFYFNYAKDLGKHRVDAMLGYSWQHFFSDDASKTFGNDAEPGSEPFNTNYNITENYLVSFFGRVNYSYDSRYMMTATVRYDGSSRFSEKNRWGLFPSVALGWNLAEESWLKDTFVNNLKLRASWGITGQQDLDLTDYPYQANYDLSTQFSQYQFGNNWYNFLKPIAYDENIKWEETASYNVGVDFAAFDSRLTFSVDAYKKYTSDLLYNSAVAAGTNFATNVITNVGDLENEGLEIQVGGDIIRNDDWRWNVTANATWQNTVITRLTASPDPNYLGSQYGDISIGTGTSALINAVGYAPGTYYLYEQVYDENGKPVQNAVVDRNGDGAITDGDRYLAGNIQPDMYYGISTSLSYKNWDLAINAHGVVGNQIFNDFNMAHSSLENAYNNSGCLVNITPLYEVTGFRELNQTQQNLSDYWLEDGSYLRVDNITLGYNFRELFGSNGPSGRISATVQNPVLVTDYTGLDPETSWGIDGTIWPRPTIFMLGLSLNF